MCVLIPFEELWALRGKKNSVASCSPTLKLQGPFFGTQQPMVWDFQLLSPVHPASAGHLSPVQVLAGCFLSLALFQPLLDAEKARRRERERGHTDK